MKNKRIFAASELSTIKPIRNFSLSMKKINKIVSQMRNTSTVPLNHVQNSSRQNEENYSSLSKHPYIEIRTLSWGG